MDVNDLVTELRDWALVQGAGSLAAILTEAADTIEAQDERIAIMSVEYDAERGRGPEPPGVEE